MHTVQVELEEAVAVCLQEAAPVATTMVKLEEAEGRICAENYYAQHNIPEFDRSRVDGYALHPLDVSRTGSQAVLTLPVAGSIKAGDQLQVILNPGSVWRVMTGAVLPRECAAVVKQEEVEDSPAGIIITNQILPGQNLEKTGSFMTAGTALTSPGQRIDALDAEKLASAGFTHIEVYQRPVVYLMQTGDELVMPGNPLPTGKIYNSNRSMFFALIREQGAQPVAGAGSTGDSIKHLVDDITRGVQKAPLIIITGGTHQGDYDLVSAALDKMGGRQLFAGINLRHGQSTSAWIVNRTLVFNLPGNPGGGYLLFHALIRPVLNQLRGLRPAGEKWLSLPLNQSSLQPQARRTLTRGTLIIKPDGQCQLVAPDLRWGQPGWEVIVDLPAAGSQAAALRCLPVRDSLLPSIR